MHAHVRDPRFNRLQLGQAREQAVSVAHDAGTLGYDVADSALQPADVLRAVRSSVPRPNNYAIAACFYCHLVHELAMVAPGRFLPLTTAERDLSKLRERQRALGAARRSIL